MDFKHLCRKLRLQSLIFIPLNCSFKVAILALVLVYESQCFPVEICVNVLTSVLAFYGVVFVGLLCDQKLKPLFIKLII